MFSQDTASGRTARRQLADRRRSPCASSAASGRTATARVSSSCALGWHAAAVDVLVDEAARAHAAVGARRADLQERAVHGQHQRAALLVLAEAIARETKPKSRGRLVEGTTLLVMLDGLEGDERLVLRRGRDAEELGQAHAQRHVQRRRLGHRDAAGARVAAPGAAPAGASAAINASSSRRSRARCTTSSVRSGRVDLAAARPARPARACARRGPAPGAWRRRRRGGRRGAARSSAGAAVARCGARRDPGVRRRGQGQRWRLGVVARSGASGGRGEEALRRGVAHGFRGDLGIKSSTRPAAATRLSSRYDGRRGVLSGAPPPGRIWRRSGRIRSARRTARLQAERRHGRAGTAADPRAGRRRRPGRRRSRAVIGAEQDAVPEVPGGEQEPVDGASGRAAAARRGCGAGSSTRLRAERRLAERGDEPDGAGEQVARRRPAVTPGVKPTNSTVEPTSTRPSSRGER